MKKGLTQCQQTSIKDKSTVLKMQELANRDIAHQNEKIGTQ